ncbi:hypothetical protein BDV24DRAFT_169866 [Aspergillus arachidicola]|uniref:Subtelomeric hrmA-associated cluster protein AFUB-079030/YDR124W-like helical bundle domain-containing protein n=1 Tax=Aspergillus arachidicola TaxID=656916 RepID=A0A5N6XNF7_9EURO|nr:hypothetical protein BDV24DRAFT_169866 [Aspergillus arachidicola]
MPRQLMNKDYLSYTLDRLGKNDCYILAKELIRHIEPAKTRWFPYNSGEAARPDWWPSKIPHTPLHTLSKKGLIGLLVGIFVQQRLWPTILDRLENVMSISKGRFAEQNKLGIFDEFQDLLIQYHREAAVVPIPLCPAQACASISGTVFPVHNAYDLPPSTWNTESYMDTGGPCDNCILINPEIQGQPINMFERFSIEYRQYDLRGSEICTGFIPALCIENNWLRAESGPLHPILEEPCLIHRIHQDPVIDHVQLLTLPSCYLAFSLRSPEPGDTLSLYWERAQGLIECVGSQLLPQENNERFIYTMEANQQAINPSGLHPELVHDTEQANIGGLADVGIVRANHSVALSEKFYFSSERELSPDTSIDLVGDGADTARPLQKRVLDLNREAASLLEQHSSGTSKRMIEFIQKTWAVTEALSHYPVGDAWKRTPADVRQSRAGAPPPCHYQSNHDSASSALTVKVGDPAMARNLRRLTNEDLVKRAEKPPAGGYHGRPTDPGVHPRRSRGHRDAWIKGVGTAARVALPSWGVVAADMPCQALGPLTEEADCKRIAQELVANNCHAWGESCETTYVGLLVRPSPGKKRSSIVIEFTTPYHANRAIKAGTIWDFQVSETVLYDRASRIVRCNNCNRYGHIGNICPNETVCGACAGKHTVHSADCQELELHLHGRKLRIFTIYNPGPWDTDRTDTVDLLDRVVPSRGDHIILGDFNLHHLVWSERDARDDPTSAGETTTTNDDTNDTSRDR